MAAMRGGYVNEEKSTESDLKGMHAKGYVEGYSTGFKDGVNAMIGTIEKIVVAAQREVKTTMQQLSQVSNPDSHKHDSKQVSGEAGQSSREPNC